MFKNLQGFKLIEFYRDTYILLDLNKIKVKYSSEGSQIKFIKRSVLLNRRSRLTLSSSSFYCKKL
jgi:hypothetical protein